jgi:MFS family permease
MALGWSVSSIIASRLLDRIRETTILLVGVAFAAAPLLIGALIFRSNTHITVVAALSFSQGLGLGGASNAGLTLLQKTANPSEMGRASATHHFTRNLGSAVGIAAAGGIVLGVAQRRLGTLDTIRPLLRGDENAIVTPEMKRAIVDGYRFANLFAVATALIGLLFALRVRASLQTRGETITEARSR